MRSMLRDPILLTAAAFFIMTAGIHCGAGKRRSEQLADNPTRREQAEYSETIQGELPSVQRPPSAKMPAIANESVIAGSVVGYCIVSSSILNIRPVMPIYQLRILVKTSEDVEDKRSFTKDQVGKLIHLHSKKELSPDLFGKVIKARVSYRGDQKGSRFWIREIDVPDSEQQ